MTNLEWMRLALIAVGLVAMQGAVTRLRDGGGSPGLLQWLMAGVVTVMAFHSPAAVEGHVVLSGLLAALGVVAFIVTGLGAPTGRLQPAVVPGGRRA